MNGRIVFNTGPICLSCIWLNRDSGPTERMSCEAFPEGIPLEYVEAEKEHLAPIPGQTGLFAYKKYRGSR